MTLPQCVDDELSAARDAQIIAEIGPLLDEALRIAEGDGAVAAKLIVQRMLCSDSDLRRRLLEVYIAGAAVRRDLVEVLS